MALIPITIRRRLRESGFSEDQTDALDEASEATVAAAREDMVPKVESQDQYHALRQDIAELRADNAVMRGEMRALKWWLLASTAGLVLAATAAIIAAIAVWG